MKEKKRLTKAETQVMSILWSLEAEHPTEGASSSEVMNAHPEPKPAMTTLLTFLKILTEKGYVATTKHGKLLSFRTTVSHEEYMRQYMTEVKNTFFGGSLASLVSFFVRNEKMDDTQVDELLDIIREQRHL